MELERNHEMGLERILEVELECTPEVVPERTLEVVSERTLEVVPERNHEVELHMQEVEHHMRQLEVLHRRMGEQDTLEEQPVVHHKVVVGRTHVKDIAEDKMDFHIVVVRCCTEPAEENDQILDSLDAAWNWSEVLLRAEH